MDNKTPAAAAAAQTALVYTGAATAPGDAGGNRVSW